MRQAIENIKKKKTIAENELKKVEASVAELADLTRRANVALINKQIEIAGYTKAIEAIEEEVKEDVQS